MIWKQLDRGVANYEWLARFPTGRVKYLNCFTSDHQTILLSLDGNGEHKNGVGNPFALRQCGFKILDVENLLLELGIVLLMVLLCSQLLQNCRVAKND